MSDIKRTWLVTDESGESLDEVKTEAKAIRVAKDWVNSSDDSEAWIFVLSHVVSRPTDDPIVEVVK